MKKIGISPELALPIDVAGEAIAILAKRGAGKTNTATVLVEELVRADVQTVIVDPVGAWWGIRSSAAGEKGAGLSVPILGGQHGDVPLEQTAGALIADVVVDSGSSLLLDLSDFPSKAATQRFVADFTERLYRRKARSSSLLHLVLEEADEFAPQSPKGGWKGDAGRMAAGIETLVRRGRSRGVGVTLITQRSAVLNKDVLTQTDVLIVMRTTGPHDVKAIKLWVDAKGEDDAGVIASLPSLATGEAWVWNPERELLQRVHVRRRRTFDSSATPKAGERRVEPGERAAIDVADLGQQIAATAEKAKSEDPRELKRTIGRLERELAAKPKGEPAERIVEKPVEVLVEVPAISDEQIEELREIATAMRDLSRGLSARADQIEEALRHVRAVPARGDRSAAALDRGAASPHRKHDERPSPRPRPEPRRQPDRAAPAPAEGDVHVSGPQQRILNALAALEAIGLGDAAKTQLALFAEASPKSSAFTNNLGSLRSAGLIDYPGPGRVALTDAGRELADASDAPQTVDELQAYVFRLVGGAKSRLLEQLIDIYPEALTKGELAERAGASATSSAFTNNLGSLRSLGLIDYPGPGLVEALPVLFLEAVA